MDATPSLLRHSATVPTVFLGGVVVAGATYFSQAYGEILTGEAVALATAASLLPLMAVVSSLVWLDRYESEPPHYMIFAFIWGAVVSAVVAPVVTGGISQYDTSAPDASSLWHNAIAPALVEEPIKLSALLLILAVRHQQCDGMIDAIVYGCLAAAGFSFAESVIDLGNVWAHTTDDSVLQVFLIRCVMGAFAHPLFTFCAAAAIGYATHVRRSLKAALIVVGGCALAVGLHVAWNYSISLGVQGFVTLYLTMQLPLFAAAAWLAHWARVQEGRLLAVSLAPWRERGIFSPAEVTMMRDLRQRAWARAWAYRAGGRQGWVAMRAWQRAITDVVYLDLRQRRLGVGAVTPESVQQALQVAQERRNHMMAMCVESPHPSGTVESRSSTADPALRLPSAASGRSPAGKTQ